MAISSLQQKNAWVSLATSTPGAVTSVSFTSLAEYRYYKIEGFGLTSTVNNNMRIRFNNDTATNYANNGASASTKIDYIQLNGGTFVLYVNDANKASKDINGYAALTTDFSIFAIWNNTATINRVDVSTASGNNFTAGTITIYGRN